MLKIGLTGGMGCGKSTIAHIFSALDIPVYHADVEAKRLSETEPVRQKIARLFGRAAAEDRRLLASIVFKDAEKLKQLNALLHPLVFQDMDTWFTKQESGIGKPPYAIVEAAILFESGMAHTLDYIIDVEAPRQTQITRCSARDNSSRQEVLERIDRQLSAKERMDKSDFVVQNGDGDRVLPVILEIDRFLRSQTEKPAIQGR